MINSLQHKLVNLEDKYVAKRNYDLAKKGYFVNLIPYICFGSTDSITLQLRATLTKNTYKLNILRKGFFNLWTKQLPWLKVKVYIQDKLLGEYETNRGGYLDIRVPANYEPGTYSITFEIEKNMKMRHKNLDVDISTPEQYCKAESDLIIMPDDDNTIGIISDIDDTILISNAPSPLRALRNMLFVSPTKRRSVPGMTEFYEYLQKNIPNSFFIYLSAGPWNQFNFLRNFMKVNNFPKAPIILQDIGPDDDKVFESTKEHKVSKLTWLFRQFPNVKWVLIGDDGQHDLSIYKDFALKYPEKVAAIVMRQLTPAQQMLNSVVPLPIYQSPFELPLSISGSSGIMKRTHSPVNPNVPVWLQNNRQRISVPIIYSNNGYGLRELVCNMPNDWLD